MSDWLDLMLDEIARKRREEREARQEIQRRHADREGGEQEKAPREPQSK